MSSATDLHAPIGIARLGARVCRFGDAGTLIEAYFLEVGLDSGLSGCGVHGSLPIDATTHALLPREVERKLSNLVALLLRSMSFCDPAVEGKLASHLEQCEVHRVS